MELIYRGTRDGSGSNIFHNKCDNQGPTICLCKNEKGNIFGGYASISWTSDNNYHYATGSFLFILINGTSITKYDYTKKDDCVVYHNSGYGPTFCGNIELYISNNYLNNQDSYLVSDDDDLGSKNPFINEDHSTKNYKLKELEVFKLFN